MSKINQTFERIEKKYIITTKQKEALIDIIKEYIECDEFGESTICNLYFDTDNYTVIRDSLEKPIYKEKLRLRSYGVPKDDTMVFLELKKKYKGIVYKRREKITLAAAKKYYQQGVLPKDTQIMKEIDWVTKSYKKLEPSIYISYKREAFYCKTDKNLRITFDSDLIFRTTDLDLEKGVYGQNILNKDHIVMEVKALKSMPIWLADAFDELHIYPTSFSKYGTAYQEYIA